MKTVFIRLIIAAVLAALVIPGLPVWADLAAAQKAYARRDWFTALREYLPLAQQGDVNAQFIVGYIYCQGAKPQYGEALKWFKLAADKGHPNAQFNLGQMYRLGQGMAKNQTEAVRWYRAAANQGFADAQLRLGIAYEEGDGVARNLTEAARLYRLSITNPHHGDGLAEAQFSLGALYHEGKGVPKDWKVAAELFEAAADRGYPQAQFNIGWMYYVPEGVEENFVKAYMWIMLAGRSANGTESVVVQPDASVAGKALEISGELSKKMTPAQLAEADRMIKAWKPKTN
jgi:TPR repeat protein